MIPSLAHVMVKALGLQSVAPAACACASARMWGTLQRAHTLKQKRPFSSSEDVDVDRETNAINDAFAQAREDIADARDDAETVYFNESAALARHSVDGVLAQWNGLLQRVPESKKGELMRSMGLKMEQLKAELKELDELHA